MMVSSLDSPSPAASDDIDLTPRAQECPTANPFESPSTSISTTTSTFTTALPSPAIAASCPHNIAPPYQHQLLSAPHHHLLASPHPNAPNPHHLTSTPSSAAALPTTSLSLHAPVFNMQQPPPPKHARIASSSPSGSSSSSSTHATSISSSSSVAVSTTSAATTASSSSSSTNSPSRGQIRVKLISARSLNVRSSHARPYVVVQFEQNEFVSRDPTDESDKEVKGVATNLSRNSSSTALSALGAISSKANKLASQSTSTNGHPHINGHSAISTITRTANHTPSSSAGSGISGLSAMFGAARISAHNPVWKHEVSFDVTSEQSVITINVYDRAANDLGFLGTVQIKPVLVHDHPVDQWYKLQPYENEPVTGEMRVQMTFEANKTKRVLTPKDFEFLKLIGRGTFGRVFQVRKRDTKRIYAMKVLSKREIVAKKEVAHTIGERKILQRSLDSPFLVGLKFSFQTDTDLYLVTDFKSGGELFWHLQKETRFSEERARFYVAELILALEHLHKYDIVYRDLKPENILLDATGHVALCDFGLSKPDLRSDELTNTFCGTTEYLAPEVLLDEHGYSKLVDFWSLGVLLFEMCCGWSPFYAEDTQQMYKNICFGKIRFPKGVINEDGKQFVKGLLNRNPKHRLGAQRDAAELKEHPFFKAIDWEALSRKQATPPFKPVVESDESVANFDPEFTTADVRDQDLSDLDDEDPSEDWVALSNQNGATHTPNGPLGSDKPPNQTSGIQMPQKKKKRDVAGTPLTNSVQENFRGFTYHGESLISDGFLAERMKNGPGATVVQIEDNTELRSTEDDLLDLESPVGRYAQERRTIRFDGFDDELHV